MFLLSQVKDVQFAYIIKYKSYNKNIFYRGEHSAWTSGLPAGGAGCQSVPKAVPARHGRGGASFHAGSAGGHHYEGTGSSA